MRGARGSQPTPALRAMEIKQNESPEIVCVTDVGSTTTKACLFRRRGEGEAAEWTMLRREAATTVEKPDEDVTIGVLRALESLGEEAGLDLIDDAGRPAVAYLSTSSAGGGLAMVVTGLVREITSRSAERVALGAGAIVLDVIALDDRRSAYKKIHDLEALRPDMVLLAGGFDGEAISGPVFLAEILNEAALHPKRNPTAPLPVIYAGNRNALPFVTETLGMRFQLHPVENIRPSAVQERLRPAREAIHRIFMEHVMSQAPGYEKLLSWVSAPVLPTPSAFGDLLALASREWGERILAVDVGGATTDVFTAHRGEVQRTVSANLGMSYSILEVVRAGGLAELLSLLDSSMDETEALNRIGEKHLEPTRLARDELDAEIERAVATLAVREAVRAHLHVLSGRSDDRGAEDFDLHSPLRQQRKAQAKRMEIDLGSYDLLIGSGGILSHTPRDVAARILVDALNPPRKTELAVDTAFIFPHLGVLASVDSRSAAQILRSLGMVRLGKVSDHRGDAHSRWVPSSAGRLAARREERIVRGTIPVNRELAIPGDVRVRLGESVEADEVIARSTRLFLRPFFLPVAASIQVEPQEMSGHLLKRPGDAVESGELIAQRRLVLRTKEYRSPVTGQIEKMLPDGSLLVREAPFLAREVATVRVADELGVAPKKLAPYMRCVVGQEVERGHPLASILTPGKIRAALSPLRGKVVEIDAEAGVVRVEPLREELEIRAWVPGVVRERSERGVVLETSGIEITGVWGKGGESSGRLGGSAESGGIARLDHLSLDDLERLRIAGVAGAIAPGADLGALLDREWPFTIVLLEGFGRHALGDRLGEILDAADGRMIYLDGTTELRVGVRRPRLILPDEPANRGAA